MTQHHPHNPHNPIPGEMLDRYLDGLLTDQEVRAFEAEMSRDPALREAVDRQRTIDASLKLHFTPPLAPVATRQPFRSTVPTMRFPSGAQGQRWRLAIAAVLVLALGATWIVLRNTVYKEPTRIAALNTVYNHLVGSGFKPEWVCSDDREFAESVDNRLGQPLLAASGLPGVEILGWAYATADDGKPKQGYDGTPISEKTMILLTRVDGREDVVLVDKLKNDRVLELPPESTLHLHRRVLGKLVLYEISPFDKPRVIDGMFKPDRLPPKKK